MNFRIRYLLLALITIAPLHSQDVNPEDAVLKAFHAISSHDCHAWVEKISSPEFTGRLTGTKGFNDCAAWLSDSLNIWGVSPWGDDGTYLQAFDHQYTLVKPGNYIKLHIPIRKGEIVLNYDYVNEFMPGATSGSGEIMAEVVYVGYGISAPELGFDEYENIDVRGKIVLMEREAPLSPNKDMKKFKKWRKYSFHQYKLENAVKHGAIGMIYNYGPISNPNNSYVPGFIYVHVGDIVVNDIFEGSGRVHEEIVKKIKKNLRPRSFNTRKQVSIKMVTEHVSEATGYNVLGFIEGSDPILKEEVILLGGHLDHLGYCHELIPGANDNASAVAIMMAVARALKSENVVLKRSIGFCFFGAEEQGVVGSKVYLENPPVPLDQTLCLLNMDGVGAGDKLFAMAGKNFPTLWKFIKSANDRYVHRQLKTGYSSNLARPRLDAARFMWANVPTLSFYAYGTPSAYHTPADNMDIITPEIMEDLARIIFMGVVDIANAEQAQFREKIGATSKGDE
ncbi:M20/M25/M40 family metallo-hydrolase [bacterium]|nr:M20/M25/M40 family metallo-hydrolase [bacterium]